MQLLIPTVVYLLIHYVAPASHESTLLPSNYLRLKFQRPVQSAILF